MQNNRPLEIILFVILTKSHGQDIASGSSCTHVAFIHCNQALILQVIIELDESRMLNDGQGIDISARRLMILQYPEAVFTLDVDVVRLSPHQSQTSTNQLLQQDWCLRRTERNEHTDVVDVKALTEHQHRDDHLRTLIPIYIEELLLDFLPFFILHLALLVAVDGNDVFIFQTFRLQKLFYKRRYRGVLADDEHLRVLRRIILQKFFFQFVQLGQSCTEHHALTFAQSNYLSLLITLGVVIQVLQVGKFLPTVEQQQFHQSLLHRHRQVKVNNDMREEEFHLLLSGTLCIKRSSREVHLYESCTLGGTDGIQASLPFHLLGFAITLDFVNMMSLIIDYHQIL